MSKKNNSDRRYLNKSYKIFSCIAQRTMRLRSAFFFLALLCFCSHWDPSCMSSILWLCTDKCRRQQSGSGLINGEMSDQIYLQSTNRKRRRVMEIVRAWRRTTQKTELKVQSHNQQYTGFSHSARPSFQIFHKGKWLTLFLVKSLIIKQRFAFFFVVLFLSLWPQMR